jgi:hypothetical protein
MTVMVEGLAMELSESSPGIAISALWPATAIESAVTVKQSLPARILRKATIFSDAVLSILNADVRKVNGRALIDEDWLCENDGMTDFTKYSVDGVSEIPRMLPRKFPSLLVAEQDDRGIDLKSLDAKL